MRGRNQGLGPSGDNPSRKITSTPSAPKDLLKIRVLPGDHKDCGGDDAGFAMVTGGSPIAMFYPSASKPQLAPSSPRTKCRSSESGEPNRPSTYEL
jgi:hypothetical protein